MVKCYMCGLMVLVSVKQELYIVNFVNTGYATEFKFYFRGTLLWPDSVSFIKALVAVCNVVVYIRYVLSQAEKY